MASEFEYLASLGYVGSLDDKRYAYYLDLATNDVVSGALASYVKSASFTLALNEINSVLLAKNSSPMTITVPPRSSVDIPDNSVNKVIQYGSGQVTFVPGSGVTIRTPPAPSGLKTRGQFSEALLYRVEAQAEPLDTTGLIADWDADTLLGATDSAVTTWTDTVNGWVLSETVDATRQPKLKVGADGISGHNSVYFDGTNDRLYNTSGGAAAIARNKSTLAIFVVYKLPGTVVTGTRCLFGMSNGLSSASGRLGLWTRNATGIQQIGGRRLDADGFATVTGGAELATGHAGIMTGVWDWGQSDVFAYECGTLGPTSTSFQTIGNTSDTASLQWAVGSNGGLTEVFIGHISRVLIYTNADAAKRANVHTYLQNRYTDLVAADYTGVPDEWILTGDTVV